MIVSIHLIQVAPLPLRNSLCPFLFALHADKVEPFVLVCTGHRARRAIGVHHAAFVPANKFFHCFLLYRRIFFFSSVLE
jgi:hypothetical protein